MSSGVPSVRALRVRAQNQDSKSGLRVRARRAGLLYEAHHPHSQTPISVSSAQACPPLPAGAPLPPGYSAASIRRSGPSPSTPTTPTACTPPCSLCHQLAHSQAVQPRHPAHARPPSHPASQITPWVAGSSPPSISTPQRSWTATSPLQGWATWCSPTARVSPLPRQAACWQSPPGPPRPPPGPPSPPPGPPKPLLGPPSPPL